MKRNAALSIGLVAAFAVVIALLVGLTRPASPEGSSDAAAGPTASAAPVVREDSHVLSDAGEGAPVLVEFLDFECEACRAAYPVVEEIRQEHEGELTFVVRYFPIPSHANAVNAAVAVEAAAQQGQFEAMYTKMYETQAQWGEQQQSHAGLFRQFAEEIGLDMADYDAAVQDPATLARIEADRQGGLALGVQGTPTFFLDGQLLNPTSVEDFRAQIDAAVNN